MANTNVFNEAEGKLHVMSRRCSTCIFRPGNLMHLEEGRVEEMVETSVENEGVIPCHQTIHGAREQHAVCRGYFDEHGDRVWQLRLAKTMGVIVYDDARKEASDA